MESRQKLAWLTDVHLDHLSLHRQRQFIESLKHVECDAFLITGDVSNGERVVDDIQHLAAALQKIVYFVLGNHDYYGSSVELVRKQVTEAIRGTNAAYLSDRSHVQLTEKAALVGHDCWYDAVYGNWKTSGFRMCDWVLIRDYSDVGAAVNGGHGRVLDPNFPRIVGKSRALAQQGVEHIEKGIDSALAAGFERIVIASHVPPFDDAHIFEGKKGDAGAQPWFTSGLLGEMLDRKARAHPDRFFTSLSGHTHGFYSGKRASNLLVRVGSADYGHPVVQDVLEI